ncbi:MAG TPA: hypothetical protein VJJ52_08220 [Candidatus Nanoarchaeia archaeon]|nr:hypothetical protein [Candidatus Nanoarchaeia archaeon]
MKKNRIGFIEWNNNILINSFRKLDFNILLIIILDSIFYLAAAGSFFLWDRFMKAKAAAINLPADPNEIVNALASLGPEKAQQIASEVKSYFFLLLFSLIAVIIFVIFLAGIFKSIIWAKTTKTKVSLKIISGFLLLNLIWMGFWLVIIFLISYIVNTESVPIFLFVSFIIGIHFTNILYPIFMQKHKLNSIGNAIKIGIAKIHLFVLPNLIIFLILFILFWATSKLAFHLSYLVTAFILVVYAALVRYYVSELTVKVEKRYRESQKD